MEVVLAGDDLGTAIGDAFDLVAPLARGLDRGLDGLGTAVRRQHAIQTGQLRESLEQQRQLVVEVSARCHAKLLRLLDQRADDLRMRVTEAHRRIRAHQIEIPATIDVEDVTALAARQHDGKRIVIARTERAFAADQLRRGVGFRSGSTLVRAMGRTVRGHAARIPRACAHRQPRCNTYVGRL